MPMSAASGRERHAAGSASDRSRMGGNRHDSRLSNPRYSQTTGVDYPASWGNLGKLFSRSFPGPGMVAGAAMDITGARPGFTGLGVPSKNFSYDPTNRAMQPQMMGGGYGMPSNINPLMQRLMGAGLYGGGTNQNKIAAAQGKPMPMQAQAPQSQGLPALQQGFVPAATLGGPIPGLGNYQMNLPGYSYFGQPGQQRPAMFNY